MIQRWTTGWMIGGSSPARDWEFFSSPLPDRLWYPPSLLSKWYQRLFHWGIKQPEREADHSSLSSAEVKEWVELYIHSPNTPSLPFTIRLSPLLCFLLISIFSFCLWQPRILFMKWTTSHRSWACSVLQARSLNFSITKLAIQKESYSQDHSAQTHRTEQPDSSIRNCKLRTSCNNTHFSSVGNINRSTFAQITTIGGGGLLYLKHR
jgi:hypothetical protein